MRPIVLAYAALLLVPALLVAPSSPTSATGCDAPIGDPLFEGAGHNHRDPAQHEAATTNMEFVSFLSPPPSWDGVDLGPPRLEDEVLPVDRGLFGELTADGLATGSARFGEVDVEGRYAAIASISSPIGVWIVDIEDPQDPVLVGRWNGPSGGYVTDVKWSSGGGALVASVQGSSGNGMYLVDASDKTRPVTAEFWPFNRGVHMMGIWNYAPIPGADVVFGASGYSEILVGIITGDLPVKRWVKLNNVFGVQPHDVWVTQDPLTLRTLLYVANSYQGIVVFDVTNPSQPVRLGGWNGAPGLYMHTIRAEVQDGRRIVVATPEYFFGSASQVPKVHVFDATDFANIRLIGTWSAAGGHAAGNLVFSTHNFQLVNGTMYMAKYHGGVWVIDVRAPEAPQTRGYYLPNDHPSPPGSSIGWPIDYTVPSDWDVVLHEGRMYVGDITGGLYVLRYACDTVGPGGPSSYG